MSYYYYYNILHINIYNILNFKYILSFCKKFYHIINIS